MSLPHLMSVCKIYQRIDNPKETVCRFPGEPLPKGGAWRYIGSRRLDDWSQMQNLKQRNAMRLDEIPKDLGVTVTPDFISHMQDPSKREPAKHSHYLMKQLFETKKRLKRKPGELPPIAPHGDKKARARLLTPRDGTRIQEGPLHFWGPDSVPLSFHV